MSNPDEVWSQYLAKMTELETHQGCRLTGVSIQQVTNNDLTLEVDTQRIARRNIPLDLL